MVPLLPALWLRRPRWAVLARVGLLCAVHLLLCGVWPKHMDVDYPVALVCWMCALGTLFAPVRPPAERRVRWATAAALPAAVLGHGVLLLDGLSAAVALFVATWSAAGARFSPAEV